MCGCRNPDDKFGRDFYERQMNRRNKAENSKNKLLLQNPS